MKDFNLDTQPKIKTGFQVPENYFEQFEAKMMEQLPQKETKVVSLFHKKQVWISSIAAVLLVMIAIPVYQSMSKDTTIEATTLENYLVSEYSTYDIIDKLSTEDINALENDLTLNEDAVESYLLDTQNIDYYLNQ
ncbi:MAG: hypothetical protein CMP76_02920 [Flavobacterium sp.]|uniref:hypothetical protein n=1 Tax=Flavobacterium sp. TaxID=239 RepID=UPI000C424E8A|nr:hypothetical protein [Flavobacterium sp.]MBF02229.1 hypothetical protein [Flavobacterium sp.]|tara:strand:+ start:51 stop:455 length:405 start_codon:yes stop_codon:yes gene_type:complete